MNPPFEIQVAERYIYHGKSYEITRIDQDRIQLRGLERYKDIIIQSRETLLVALRKGTFRKTQDAPFSGEDHKIISALPDKQKVKLETRLTYIRNVLDELGGRLPVKKTNEIIKRVSAMIGDLKPPHYNTLFRWFKRYTLSGEDATSLISLKKRKQLDRIQNQHPIVQDLIKHQLETLYFTRTPATASAVCEAIQLSIEHTNKSRPLHDQLHTPSTTTLYRIINELDPYYRELKQKGKRRALQSQKWSRKGHTPYYVLDTVECDSQKLDIEVVDENGDNAGRPYLTVALEKTSHCVNGWDISLNAPSIDKTMRAISRSLLETNPYGGIAQTYVVDNGPEFSADRFKNIMSNLGARIVFCEPGNGDQKPNVERFFRIFGTQIVHHMRGTTFSSILEKGEYNSRENAIYTIDELNSIFSDWLDNVYHKQLHSNFATSPDCVWANKQAADLPPRKLTEDDLHRHFLSTAYVTPNGGRVRLNNLFWTGPGVAYLSSLLPKGGKLLLHYDPSELGRAWISLPNNRERVYEIEAVDSIYQKNLTFDMHTRILKRFSEACKKFNNEIAKYHKIRIITEISSLNKRSPKKRKNTSEKTCRKNIKQNHHREAASNISSYIHKDTPPTSFAMELEDGSGNV